MIDKEIYVFDNVYHFVMGHPKMSAEQFASQYVPSPPKFPYATLEEITNVTAQRYRSTAQNEDMAIVAYEANVYANTKKDCREVMNCIDAGMNDLNFIRDSMNYVDNVADRNLFRLVCRFRAYVDANGVFYRPGRG